MRHQAWLLSSQSHAAPMLPFSAMQISQLVPTPQVLLDQVRFSV